MSNKDVTYIYSKILKEDGQFDDEIHVLDSESTIAIGNSKLLFDSSAKKYYKFTAIDKLFEILPIKTTSSGTFGPVLY